MFPEEDGSQRPTEGQSQRPEDACQSHQERVAQDPEPLEERDGEGTGQEERSCRDMMPDTVVLMTTPTMDLLILFPELRGL